MRRNDDGTPGAGVSALQTTSTSGCDERASALWGKGGRGPSIALAMSFANSRPLPALCDPMLDLDPVPEAA